jgi:hypothetical protein
MRILILIAAVFVAMPAVARAQRAADLREGARIQVTPARGKPIIGGFASLANDSLAVVLDDAVATRRVIPVRQVRRVHISTGRNHAQGAAVGALIGAGVGVLSGVAVGLMAGPDKNCSFICYSRSENAAMGGIVFGGIGAIVGTLSGAIRGTERWEQISLPRH